ncbi:MAG: hypothetical protein NT169_21910 [Chloroflexi bacterium]|nr:hypothetical protein [Chloroflexota bacterium]
MTEQRIHVSQGRILCVFVVILLLTAGLTGCKSTPTPMITPTLPSSPTQPPTQPSLSAPAIDPPGPQITIEAGKKIPIRANAAGAKRYEWKLQGKGSISETQGDAIFYAAPEAGGEIAIVTVLAFNDQGVASPPTSLTINSQAMGLVRLDALGIPAGFMAGVGDPGGIISLGPISGGCHTDMDCIQFTYRRGGGWGGIYWWPLTCGASGTPDAWAKVQKGVCGVNVPDVGNFDVMNRLTFWARGERGGEVVEFKIGAVDVLPKPGRSLGKVTLSSTWKQYEISLKGMDLTNAIGLFAWIATDMDNPDGAAFYLDDIQFEGLQK